MDDLNEETVELLEIAAEQLQEADEMPDELDAQEARTALELEFGMDFAEVDPDEAELAQKALGDDVDPETEAEFWEMMEEKADKTHAVERVKEQWKSDGGDAGGNDSAADTPASTSDTGASGGTQSDGSSGVSRGEVRSIIREEIQNVAQGGGGGGQPAGGGADDQMGLEILKAIAQMKGGNSGPSPFEKAGANMAKMSMYESLQRLHKPSFGERIGEAIEAKMAEQVGADIANKTDGPDIDLDPEEVMDMEMFGFDESDEDEE